MYIKTCHRNKQSQTQPVPLNAGVAHRPSPQRPSTMKGLFVPLLLGGLCQAVRVYLHPGPSFPPRLSVSHAGAALSAHLNLERFEDAPPYPAEQELLIGSGMSTGILLTISEEDAKGESPTVCVHDHAMTLEQKSSRIPSPSPHSPSLPLSLPTPHRLSSPPTSNGHIMCTRSSMRQSLLRPASSTL